MAELLRRENDLAVLRIRLERQTDRRTQAATSRGESTVAFEFQAGEQDAQPLGRMPVSQIGLGKPLQGSEREPAFTVPGDLVPELQRMIEGDRTLWLEFPRSCGHLPLVPWEALLSPALERPVLRLPYFALLPRAAGRSLEVAVVVSAPRAKARFDSKAMLDALVEGLRGATDVPARVHAFADADEHGRLVDAYGADVTVHDPQRAEQFDLPRAKREISTVAEVRNPWLLWVLQELGHRAIDAVHFVCHGYYAQEHGAIALASSPLVNTDRNYSRLVGAAELNAFLTAAGAWSVGFTGPPSNFAPIGLRKLADSLAQTRPLHVLSHEGSDPAAVGEVGAAYALMLARRSRRAPALRQSALWVHPQVVSEERYEVGGSPEDAWLDDAGQTLLLGTETEKALDAEATPSWVAASTRAIEQVHGELLGRLGETRSPPLEAVSSDEVERALNVAAELLERHVRAAESDGIS
jgi:hypothetical protein